MIILGIDPGYAILGWSVIDSSLKLHDFGTIQTDQHLNIEDRLFIIHESLSSIIKKYKPECLSIEKLFFQKNTKTAIDVAKTIGAVILTARINGLAVFEYSPVQIKKSLTGYGNAEKKQMQNMIKTVFNLETIPRPDDAADAAAIALCHTLSTGKLNIK